MLDPLWRALGGSPHRAGALEIRRRGAVLASPLPVEELLTGAAGCTLLAAAELAEARTGRAPAVALDVDRLAVAACSERWVRVDGEPVGVAFDPLSRFFRAQLGPAGVEDADDVGAERRLELDLREPAGRDALERLLAEADVVVDGHRPGALDRFGLSSAALAERHPQVVHVSLSAWGETGPWPDRRGFDSLVQAAIGIAEAVRPGTDTQPPGVLPVQALDHATGYLLAAATLRALADRHRTGYAARVRLALAATGRMLLEAGRREPDPDARDPDPTAHLTTLGRLQVALPPGEVDGVPLRWVASRG